MHSHQRGGVVREESDFIPGCSETAVGTGITAMVIASRRELGRCATVKMQRDRTSEMKYATRLKYNLLIWAFMVSKLLRKIWMKISKIGIDVFEERTPFWRHGLEGIVSSSDGRTLIPEKGWIVIG